MTPPPDLQDAHRALTGLREESGWDRSVAVYAAGSWRRPYLVDAVAALANPPRPRNGSRGGWATNGR
jgi:hypothetical protein